MMLINRIQMRWIQLVAWNLQIQHHSYVARVVLTQAQATCNKQTGRFILEKNSINELCIGGSRLLVCSDKMLFATSLATATLAPAEKNSNESSST